LLVNASGWVVGLASGWLRVGFGIRLRNTGLFDYRIILESTDMV